MSVYLLDSFVNKHSSERDETRCPQCLIARGGPIHNVQETPVNRATG